MLIKYNEAKLKALAISTNKNNSETKLRIMSIFPPKENYGISRTKYKGKGYMSFKKSRWKCFGTGKEQGNGLFNPR